MSSNQMRRRLLGGAVGSFVEWYDFLVYGLSAPVLALKFFPHSSQAAGLISTYAVYAVSYFVRPAGGIVIGRIGDRLGRIRVLGVVIVVMGGATALLGLLPTYATIGVAAPVLLVMCRLIQGVTAGGEASGALSFLLEAAPPNRRGLWISIFAASTWAPVVVASGLTLILRTWFGSDAFTSWAWRIPFIFGGLIAVVGLWLRRRLQDPDEYVQAARENTEANLIASALKRHWRSMVLVAFLVAVQGVGAYLMLSYMYSYLVTVTGLTPTQALVSNAIGVAAMAAVVLPAGLLSDRFGRKTVMYAGAGWLVALSWPAMKLISAGGLGPSILGQLILAVGVASFAAGGYVCMVELFSTSMRFTGHSIGYNVGYAVFGGTAPLVASALVGRTGSPLSPGLYLAGISVLGLVAVFMTPETRHVRLRDAGLPRNHAGPAAAAQLPFGSLTSTKTSSGDQTTTHSEGPL